MGASHHLGTKEAAVSPVVSLKTQKRGCGVVRVTKGRGREGEVQSSGAGIRDAGSLPHASVSSSENLE